jgi:hypothetical protein
MAGRAAFDRVCRMFSYTEGAPRIYARMGGELRITNRAPHA